MTATQSFTLKQLRLIVRSPWMLMTALTLGIIVGIQAPDAALKVAPLGKLYLSLLKMCVLPILISGIVLSVARLMSQTDAASYVKRILTIFPIALGIVSVSGLISALVLGPGRNLDGQTLRNLGILINSSSVDLEIPLTGTISQSESLSPLATFLFNIVPDNIFNALTQGQTLQVLFFTIAFGISLGVLHREQNTADPIFEVLDNIYKAFNKLIAWLIFFLPLGLFSLISSQVSQSGVDAIKVMAKFVLCSLLVFALLYFLGVLIIWKLSGLSWNKVIKALQEPTIVALATSSALAAMPVASTALNTSLKCNQDITDMILPLAITIGRFGQVSYFVIASLFVIQLYDNSITPQTLLVVILGSILAGIASSGSTGIVTLSTLNVVLNPLGLPLESVLLLFIAVDPLVDPFRTLCTLHTGIVATTVISKASTSAPPQLESMAASVNP